MLFAFLAMSNRIGFYSSSKVFGWIDRDHHCRALSVNNSKTLTPRVKVLLCRCLAFRFVPAAEWSERIAALPAGQLNHSFAQTFLSTLAGTAGASALGSRAIRDRHHYHDLQIADGDKGLRHTQGGVTFGLSPRVAFLIVQTPFRRNGSGNLVRCCCQGTSLFPGSFFLGLTLPFDRLSGSALPLPVIPAQAPPFD